MTIDQSRTVSDVRFGLNGETWEEILHAEGLANGQAAYVTSPGKAPREVYPPEPGLEAGEFELGPRRLTDVQRQTALDAMAAYLTDKRDHMLGYQFGQDMNDYRLDLARFLDCHINNMGDPFDSGGYKPHTRTAERAVLDYYAALWRAEWPHNPAKPDSYWGYMLSMGSSEANLYAMWNARDYLAGKALIKPKHAPDTLLYVQAEAGTANPNAYHPVAFFSEDTHYSFAKAMRVLDIDTFYSLAQRKLSEAKDDDSKKEWQCPLLDKHGKPLAQWPVEVPSKAGPEGPGEIDVEALVTLVTFFAEKGYPILVSLNYGSTFKGAHDNVEEISGRLLPIFEKNGLVEREIQLDKNSKKPDFRRGFWIHVDGALGAGYAPFMRMAHDKPTEFGWKPEVELPQFDFGLRTARTKDKKKPAVDMVCSISMSGHKWPGAPWPCGIYMTKVKYQMAPPSTPQYIGALDTTFAGSRNGFSPLVLWDHLARHSYKDQVELIRRSQELAQYLERRLKEIDTKDRLWPARTPGALTVRFRRPNDRIVAKWSLSSAEVTMTGGERRRYVHVFMMPSATKEKIDELIFDLQTSDAFQDSARKTPADKIADVPTTDLADGVISLAGVAYTGRGLQ